MNDTNSNTKPETDRTSVRMWPGITAGLVIGLIAHFAGRRKAA